MSSFHTPDEVYNICSHKYYISSNTNWLFFMTYCHTCPLSNKLMAQGYFLAEVQPCCTI